MAFGPLAAGLATGIIKGIKAGRQNSMANKIVVPDATYNTSPFAKAMLTQATQMKNARMVGAANAEQNIAGNQANTVGAINRNAMSGAQALAMVTASQGNSNQAYNQLQQNEGQYGIAMANQMNQANQQMIGEGDKEYQDRVRKQTMAMNEKAALRKAANDNFGGAMNDVVNGSLATTNALLGVATGGAGK